MTKFVFTEAAGVLYLTVRPGCHVRVDQIVAITAGLTAEDRADTVFVHLTGGSFAAFVPSVSAEEAQGMTLDLLDALSQACA